VRGGPRPQHAHRETHEEAVRTGRDGTTSTAASSLPTADSGAMTPRLALTACISTTSRHRRVDPPTVWAMGLPKRSPRRSICTIPSRTRALCCFFDLPAFPARRWTAADLFADGGRAPPRRAHGRVVIQVTPVDRLVLVGASDRRSTGHRSVRERPRRRRRVAVVRRGSVERPTTRVVDLGGMVLLPPSSNRTRTSTRPIPPICASPHGDLAARSR